MENKVKDYTLGSEIKPDPEGSGEKKTPVTNLAAVRQEQVTPRGDAKQREQLVEEVEPNLHQVEEKEDEDQAFRSPDDEQVLGGSVLQEVENKLEEFHIDDTNTSKETEKVPDNEVKNKQQEAPTIDGEVQGNKQSASEDIKPDQLEDKTDGIADFQQYDGGDDMRIVKNPGKHAGFLRELSHRCSCTKQGCEVCANFKSCGFITEAANNVLATTEGHPYRSGVNYKSVDWGPRGRFGTVTKAMDVKTSKKFAVKKLSRFKQFQREEVDASIVLKGAGTPDILGVTCERDEEREFNINMMFEFMCGPTVDDMLGELLPQPRDRVIRWLRQMLYPLDQMLKHGIIHCDLHEKNMMFRTPNCEDIVLVDFGRAKILEIHASLGMEDGRILDDQISASTELHPELHGAHRARLNKISDPDGAAGAWSPADDNQQQWIAVDLEEDTSVLGIITQGRDKKDEWVTEYYVAYKKKWGQENEYRFVKDAYNKYQVFRGNRDSSSPVVQHFLKPVEACNVCIHPLKWHKSIALRFELFGPSEPHYDNLGFEHAKDMKNAIRTFTHMLHSIDDSTESEKQAAAERQIRALDSSYLAAPKLLQDKIFQFKGCVTSESCFDSADRKVCHSKYSRLGLEDGKIEDSIIQASSELDKDHAASNARLCIKPRCGPYQTNNGWSPKGPDEDEQPLITVYLKKPTKLTGILTQGHGFDEKWVEEYLVYYQTQKKGRWFIVKGFEGHGKIFTGNKDNETAVEHLFPEDITAISIRVQPVVWHNYIALRFELLGEPDTPAPHIDTTHVISQYLETVDESTERHTTGGT